MRRVLRDVMTFAALAVVAGACTVEDVKDTRAADSALSSGRAAAGETSG